MDQRRSYRPKGTNYLERRNQRPNYQKYEAKIHILDHRHLYLAIIFSSTLIVRMRRTLLSLVLILSTSAAALAEDHDVCLERDGERSIEACTRVIETGALTGKDLATIYVLRGSSYRTSQQYTLAIADLTRAIDLLKIGASNEVVASAYVTRASLYALAGDLSSALSDYRQAFVLDNTNERAAQGVQETSSTLSSAQPSATITAPASRSQPSETDKNSASGYDSLVACCIAYCHLVRCNSPPLPRACSREILALYKGMSYDDQKKNYLLGAKAYLGRRVSIPACN